MTFNELGLERALLKVLNEQEYERPTPIQKERKEIYNNQKKASTA